MKNRRFNCSKEGLPSKDVANWSFIYIKVDVASNMQTDGANILDWFSNNSWLRKCDGFQSHPEEEE